MADSSDEISYGLSMKEDADAMLDLCMKFFVKMEPTSKSCILQGLNTEEDFVEFFKKKIADVIGNEFTVVARHRSNPVGLRLVKHETLDEYISDDMMPLREIQKMMEVLNENRTVELPQSFLHLQVSAVDSQYQNRGISGKMADWVIERAKQAAIPGIVSEATGFYSQSLLLKREFECVSELVYSEYKNPKDGFPVFQHTHPHSSLKMLLLKL